MHKRSHEHTVFTLAHAAVNFFPFSRRSPMLAVPSPSKARPSISGTQRLEQLPAADEDVDEDEAADEEAAAPVSEYKYMPDVGISGPSSSWAGR